MSTIGSARRDTGEDRKEKPRIVKVGDSSWELGENARVSNAQRYFPGASILATGRGLRDGALDQRAWLRVGLRVSLVGLAYYAAARVGLALAFGHSNVTPVWPPSGIAVAALLILGRRYWPALALAAFLVNLTTGLPPAVALVLATGNTLEYTLAASLLLRFALDDRFHRLRDLILLATLGAIVSPLVAATFGTAGLWVGGVIPSIAVPTVWTLYWVGDGMGILVFAPLILVWRHARTSHLSPVRWVEAGSLALAVGLTAGVVFLKGVNLPYLIFPLAIWAAVRFGQRGAAATAFAASGVAIWGTIHGLGPFDQGATTERLANLQLYMAAFTLTGLALAAAVLSRRDSEQQLQATNEELEAFAYTVSHDLRAPLRAVDGFSRMLLAGDSANMTEETAHHLGRIAENASQMGNLIDALLSFARLGQRPLDRQVVSLSTIARQVLDRLDLDATATEIVVDEMPPCSADPVLLGQVYQNLLDNAVKFTQGRAQPRIEVGWKRTPRAEHGPVYYVRDNGAGFDMRYVGKLFGVFQRLHRQAEFPGTGAGLAIARRIVLKHGGQMWADAIKDEGATFFFTLGEEH